MKPKRITAFLLSVAMTVSLLPTFAITVSADETQTATTEKNITLGTSHLKGAQQSNVYFGNYKQSSNGNGGYNIDPIKWRVLDTDNDYDRNAVEGETDATRGLFLLSDQNLDVRRYMAGWWNTTWANSAESSTSGMRWWLNRRFIDSAFSSAEKNAIVKTSVANQGTNLYGKDGGNDTEDQIFLLSVAEVLNSAYGFNADSNNEDGKRISTNTAYVAAGGDIGCGTMSGIGEADAWWLRGPGIYQTTVAAVKNSGKVHIMGYDVNVDGVAVRPAFNLDTSDILFTSVAKDGKNGTVGTVSKNVDVSESTRNDGYKLTLLENSRSGFAVEQTETSTAKDGTLKFAYSNAKTGGNEYISAMITSKDGKDVLYYGRLANVTQASGTAELKIPSDITFGEYKIKLFNEQTNGDKKTDFASDFTEFALTVDALAGSGAETDPYLIYTLGDLEYFRDKVNGGNSYNGKFVKLANDIDMSTQYNGSTGTSWTPIGTLENKFKGTFDGDRHEIAGLYINSTSDTEVKYQGLFGDILGATVKNLTVDGTVSGNNMVNSGGIVGTVGDSTIENCCNKANVTTGKSSYDNCIGGIAGQIINTTIKSCHNMGNISGAALYIGGIAGIITDDKSIIENCYNTGKVSTTYENSKAYIGGILGDLWQSSLKNSYNVGEVTAPSSATKVGGAVGNLRNDTTISGSVESVYYLKTCAGTGTNFDNTDGTSKTADEFANGEVAWLLQKGQSTQVWGQQLVNTAPDGETSNKDSYPVLTSDSDKKVNKITFMQMDTESTFKEYSAKYANKKLAKADLPAVPGTVESYDFWWSENKDKVKFDENTEITGDVTVYAMSGEKTEASDEDDKITLNKNKEITPIDLSDYVRNKSGSEKNFAFYLEDESTLPAGLEFNESTGKITGMPTKVGTYTVKFNVANNGGISTMSLESVNNVDVLTLTISVDLEGEGTEENPYLINDLDELEYFRDKVNDGTMYEGWYVKLMADIPMSSKYGAGGSWTPIGTGVKLFGGTFDGNNKTISGLYIDKKTNKVGLFSEISTAATVKNLTVSGNVLGYDNVGIIAGYSSGKIENCSTDGKANGRNNVGGIVGTNDGEITACKNSATVIPCDGAQSSFGGIAGQNNGKIIGCENSGNVDCYDFDRLGGITGENFGTVKKCSNSGDIKGKTVIGGIVGYNVQNNATVDNCFNNGSVHAKRDSVGGICGKNNGTAKNCYNVGKISEGFTGNGDIGAIVGCGNAGENCFYLTGCVTQVAYNYTANSYGTEMTEDEFNSGAVAWLLQKEQSEVDDDDKIIQVWGQKIRNTAEEGQTANNDKYPVLTNEADKTVYAVGTYANKNRDDDYSVYQTIFGNKGDTVTPDTYEDENKEMFRGWSTEKNKADMIVTSYTIDNAKADKQNKMSLYSIWNTVTFDVSDTRQTYLANTSRTVKITPKVNGQVHEKVTADAFKISYYEVDENTDNLKSTSPTGQNVAIGKYLYVIDFADNEAAETAKKYCYIMGPYVVNDVNLPAYIETVHPNAGFMYITSGAEAAQKPIYFAKQVVNAKMTDTVENALTNSNASTVTYTSSDESVATVDNRGNVTIAGAGSTVIVATSKKENAADVYASYTLNVTKEVITVTAKDKSISYGDDFANDGYTVSKDGITLDGTPDYTTDYKVGDGIGKYEISVSGLTSNLYDIEYKSGKLIVGAKELTADDFEVTVKDKTYDGSDKADVTAKVKDTSLVSGDVVTVLVSGTFDKKTVDASKVNYTITGLSGKDSSNYVVKNDISGENTTAKIEKAKVTVSVPSYTSYVYDKDGKSVSVFAYADGIYFDKFKVTYNGETTLPTNVGTYNVGITLTDDNYELDGAINATLEIKSAQQDVFSIEGISDSVTYGDELTLQTAGAIAGGSVSYEITSGNEFVNLDGNEITIKGVGTVTVKATSTKANYADKTATRTFVIKPKTISVTAEATSREYNGTKDIEVTLTPVGLVGNDSVTVTKTSATVATADVENNKTVFVSGLAINNPNYQLSANSVQTTVNITKKPINNITLKADNKIYDGTEDVTGYTVTIADSDIVPADKNFLTVTGTAKYNSKNVKDASKVTLSDLVLSGTKSGNYELKVASVDDTNAKITKATVNFEFGTLSYAYDGNAKTVPVTATVGGKAFDGYTVKYDGAAEQTNVGRYDIEITLKDSDNYTSDYTSTKQLEITIADQSAMTITGLLGTIEYGKTFGLTAVGGSNEITATWESSDTSIATVSEAGVVTIVGTGKPVTITATKAANGNFKAQTASVTFTPVKKTATFKITNLTQSYNGSKKKPTVETNAGRDYEITYTSEDGTVLGGEPTQAGTYYIEVKAIGNYEGEQSAIFTIKKAGRVEFISLEVSPDDAGNIIYYGKDYTVKVIGYSGNNAVITYSGTGLYSGQTTKPVNAGNYAATLTIEDDNYVTVTHTVEFTIEKATLYAKPEDKSRAYGEQNPAFTIKYYSDETCKNEVTNADVMIAPVMSTSATASTAVGEHKISATGGYAENYTFKYVDGKLTIGTATGGNFYISGGNTNPYVGNKFTLTAYYNNERPTVAWSTSDDKIATVDKDGNVEIVGTGEAKIIAKMKDSRFDSSLEATFTLTAARLPETQNAIIFDTPIVEKYANDDNFTVKPSNVSDGASVTYKSSNSGIASVNETTGEVTINKVGTVVITATATKFNCPDVHASYTLSIKKIPVTITADDKTITYGEAFTGTATFSNNLKAADFSGTLGFNTRYTVGKDVDEYDVTPTGLTSDKYDITFVSGTITVTEKKLTADDFTVTANGKTYDGTDDVEISAKVNDDKVVGNDKLYVEVEGAFEDENAGKGKTVNYDIKSLSGRGFENYVLDGTTGLTTTANIEKSEVTFFVSSETVKNYDAKVQSVEISAMANGNVFGNENYTVYYQKDGEEKTTAPANVGEYNVSVELKDSKNYTVKNFTAKLIIEQNADIELTIKGSNKNVTVGDVFTLYAQYGNDKAAVTWTTSNDKIATVDENGNVTILKSGDVKITATMKDENLSGLSADFELTASKKHLTLSASATELVKVYNGKVQNITFTAGAISLDDVTIDTSYVMITDSSKTEPKDVGTYAVSYTIDDERYEGNGNLTLVINKATVTVSADSIEKEYGEDPEYKLIVSDNVEGINAETMKELVTITSDGAAKTANVGEYDINAELTKTSDENCNYVLNADANGKLNVIKATLTVNVADITREFGTENPTELTYTINGFKNDEKADILTGSIAPVYAETIKEEIGTQKDVVTALSTLENGNYNVEVKYVDGNGADLIITKIAVKASAGTSRASYLTVYFDKAVDGVSFKVTDANGDVGITSVTASDDNKSYTLNGTFTVGTAYTVEITYDNATQEITNKTLTIIPSVLSSGGGGGGSSTSASYTVTFETNGGNKIDSVKVEKNKTVKEPTAPTKDGFDFDGWYTDKELTNEYNFDTKVTKAITLYAKWTEKNVDDNKDDNKGEDDDSKPSTNEWKNPFTDVSENNWFFDYVRYANEKGLMGGMTDTEFAPNETLTRAMLVTVLYRADGEPAVNKSIPFADVNVSGYYANAVIWAQQNGIVNGITETEFAPDENITREQIATIVYRYAKYKGIAPTGAWAIKLDYADVADISDYAVEGVMYCTMKNIMQGKDNNMFAPKDNATRAEIAAILQRFIESNK